MKKSRRLSLKKKGLNIYSSDKSGGCIKIEKDAYNTQMGEGVKTCLILPAVLDWLIYLLFISYVRIRAF